MSSAASAAIFSRTGSVVIFVVPETIPPGSPTESTWTT